MRGTLSLALQLFFASGLALAAAMYFDLANPFWAAMPVWVVHQVFREDLLLRALLRVVGTCIGAAISLLLIWTDPSLLIMLVILAAGIGISVAVAYWIGSIMSYGAFMAGITMLVVLLPHLAGIAPPGTMSSLGLATERIICTLIGVICVTAITFPFTPPRTGSMPKRLVDGRIAGSLRRGLLSMMMAVIAALMVMSFPRFDILAGGMTLVVYPMIMGSAPDPRPILNNLVPGVLTGVIAGLVFLWITTAMHNNTALETAAITAVFLLSGAFLRAHPKSAPIGLDANMCFLLVAEVGTWRHGVADASLAAAALVTAAVLAAIAVSFTLIPRSATI